MTRPVCPFHPDGQPMLARTPATTTGKYFCMRCVPPRELGSEENVPPPEWESLSVTNKETGLIAEFIGQPRIELLGMEGEYHLIAVTFPVTCAGNSRLDVVPNGCYGLVLRIRPIDLPRYLGGAQLAHKTIRLADQIVNTSNTRRNEMATVEEEWKVEWRRMYDTISRLTRKKEELEKMVSSGYATLVEVQNERDSIHQQAAEWQAAALRVEQERDALRAEFIHQGPHGDEIRATVIWQDDEQVTQEMWDKLYSTKKGE